MRRFKTKLKAEGPRGAWTFMHLPFDVEKAFGSRGRVSVRGTMNGFEFRSSIFPNGDGTHHMMVNKAMQAEAGARPGDTVAVTMDVDDAPRNVEVPAELTKALAQNKAAKQFFDGLSASCRKEYADWIAQAKKQETRASRVEKAVRMLLSGQKRVKM